MLYEASKLNIDDPDPDETARRLDLRGEPIFTIDGAESMTLAYFSFISLSAVPSIILFTSEYTPFTRLRITVFSKWYLRSFLLP